MTSIPGAAITSMKMDGAPHEFSTIKGVSNDTSDIILNLKKIRFKMLNEDATSELINFEIKGPCVLEASEINNCLTDFEVINVKEKIRAHIIDWKKDIEIADQCKRDSNTKCDFARIGDRANAFGQAIVMPNVISLRICNVYLA